MVGVVRRAIRRHRMIGAGDRVLVGVSGGSDSAGLALILAELRGRLGCELVLGHVHHGLRGAEADAGEAAAAAVAGTLGLRFVRADAAVAAGGNLEARARAARYRALHELAAAAGCNRIATGHTRDDQAETFLLRLLRGAGADGLGGIRPLREDGVVRPLLDCDREALAAVVRHRGLAVCGDAMNDDPRFLRTRVRHELLPLLRDLNPRAVSLAARAAEALRAAAAAERRWAAGVLAGAGEALPLAALEGLPAELRASLVRAWLRRVAPAGVAASRLIAAVERLAEAGSAGRRIDLAPGWRVERRGDRLVVRELLASAAPSPFTRRQLAFGETVEVPGGWRLRAEVGEPPPALPSDLWSAVCDLDACGPLLVRPPRRGERVRPLGMAGSKKLGDILAARRVPRDERLSYPVVASAGDPEEGSGCLASCARRPPRSANSPGDLRF
jgi:tRNA(Ile)-lysidine synthase